MGGPFYHWLGAEAEKARRESEHLATIRRYTEQLSAKAD